MEKKLKQSSFIFFCRLIKKELKLGTLSADKAADYRPIGRPIGGGVNVIAVLTAALTQEQCM